MQTYISTADASQQMVKEKHSPGKPRIGYLRVTNISQCPGGTGEPAAPLW